MKHTHRANCQICGRLQALNVATELVAKHGYVIKGFSYFMGTCPGSDMKPMQRARNLTDGHVVELRSAAVEVDAKIVAVDAGKLVPTAGSTGKLLDTMVNGVRKFVSEVLPFAELDKHQQAHAVTILRANLVNRAKGLRQHADALEQLVNKVHGTEPMDLEAPVAVVIGLPIKLHGRTGEVVELGVNKGVASALCTLGGTQKFWFTLAQVRSYHAAFSK